MMTWAQKAAKRLIRWAVGDELGSLAVVVREAESSARRALMAVQTYHRQLSALQALDVDLHGGGKVILLTRVQERDRIKIIDIAPKMTVQQYQQFVEEIKERYGARLHWVDTPITVPREVFAEVTRDD